MMDSVGIGAQPDAADYKSVGANTFHHAAESLPDFRVPNLERLGFGNIVGVNNVPTVDYPLAHYGRMTEITSGNDTFAGVWEMAGVTFAERFASFYPRMSADLVRQMQQAIGTLTLCNAYVSGFKVFDECADQHFATGQPIVYTCDDGVVLVAAHESVVPPARLHDVAWKMSRFFIGKNVTRIIARAFIGEKGDFVRTENRADIVVPLDKNREHLFRRIREVGMPFTVTEHLASVIGDEFVTETIPGVMDSAGVMDAVLRHLGTGGDGAAMFVVPDFDMSGHARKPRQYARDLMYFDQRLGEVLPMIGRDDLLLIVADHGCDPVIAIRGHTREYVPLLALNGGDRPGSNLGTRASFADLGQTVCHLIGANPIPLGESFADNIKE
ncbi:phosphopentomutase [Patescibacteria group bacterium]|nr:phosphopentomutase [Patescibacteria group bacterium]